jgi:hypothetical protein
MAASTSTRARRAYERDDQEWDHPEDLDPAFLHRFQARWSAIEEEITVLQDAKKTMLAAIRSHHGRHQAEAVRVTMRLMAMEPLKRAEHFHFNETARRYVAVIEAAEEYVQ